MVRTANYPPGQDPYYPPQPPAYGGPAPQEYPIEPAYYAPTPEVPPPYPPTGRQFRMSASGEDEEEELALRQRRKKVLIVLAVAAVVIAVFLVLVSVPIQSQAGSGAVSLSYVPDLPGWGLGWTTINTTHFGKVSVNWNIPGENGPTGAVAVVNGVCLNSTACYWATTHGFLCLDPDSGDNGLVSGTCTFTGPAGTYTLIAEEDSEYSPGNTIDYSFTVGYPMLSV